MTPSRQVKAILRLVNARVRELERLRVSARQQQDQIPRIVTALDEARHIRTLIKRELEEKDETKPEN